MVCTSIFVHADVNNNAFSTATGPLRVRPSRASENSLEFELVSGGKEIYVYSTGRRSNLNRNEDKDNFINGVIEWLCLSGKVALRGQLGIGLPRVVEESTTACDAGIADQCFEFGDYARLYMTQATVNNSLCARIEWSSTYGRRLEDCFELQSGVHW